MSDSPVVGSASFELRATRDKLARDVRGAETDLKKSVERIEKDYGKSGQRSADAFAGSTRKMAGHADDAAKAVSRSSGLMTAALGGIATAAAGVGFSALIQGAKDVAAAGAEIQKTADGLNVGTTRLQELRYAASEAKVSVSDLEGGLGKLNTLLGEFRAGVASRDIEPVFERLQIRPEDLRSIQDADQFLGLIADRLQLVGDNAEKAAILDKLQIEDLLPLAKLGSDGINDLASAASNLGMVIEGDMIARLAEADAQMQRSATQMDNLRIVALAPLAEGFGKVAEGATAFILEMTEIERRSPGWQKAITGALRALPGGTPTSLLFQRLAGGPGPKPIPEDVDDPAALRTRMALSRPVRGYQPRAPRRSRSGGGRSSGPSQAELAAQREMLSLQGQIEVLRAQGRDQDAAAAQRKLTALTLTQQYERAGFQNARALADAQVDAVARAQAAQAGLNAAREEGKRWLDMAVDAQRANASEALDRVRYEAEIARLTGNPASIEARERELYIAERINDLLRDKQGLITAADLAAAKSVATSEADEIGSADREGRLREEFRRSFTDGLRAAMDGDIGGLFESLADRFTSRMLDNLSDDLFDILMKGGKGAGGAGGGNIFSSIASLFSKGVPGFASGGSITKGGLAYVHQGEVLANLSAGTSVIPAHAVRAMGGMAGGMGGAPASRGSQVIQVEPSQYFDVKVREVTAPQSAATFSAARKTVPSDMARTDRYTLGRRR